VIGSITFCINIQSVVLAKVNASSVIGWYCVKTTTIVQSSPVYALTDFDTRMVILT